MERKHKEIIEKKFGRLEKKIHLLKILDDYKYMDEDLIRELEPSLKIE